MLSIRTLKPDSCTTSGATFLTFKDHLGSTQQFEAKETQSVNQVTLNADSYTIRQFGGRCKTHNCKFVGIHMLSTEVDINNHNLYFVNTKAINKLAASDNNDELQTYDANSIYSKT